jgi:ParB-like chromosome segregation protein Spo0J
MSKSTYKFHPACELFPLMNETELKELADDIKRHGLLYPVVRENGVILEGRNRLKACEMAGVKPRFTERTGGGSAVDFIIASNIRRRHLTPEQKRDLLIKVIALQPERSNRQIAKTVGVSDKTVGAARKKGEDVRKIPHVAKRTDSKGRKQPARKAPKGKQLAEAVIAKNKAAVNAKDPPKQSPSETALVEFKFAINRYVPRLDADDLKKARAIFEATASTSGALRASGSAEVPEDVRRAEMEMLAEKVH